MNLETILNAVKQIKIVFKKRRSGDVNMIDIPSGHSNMTQPQDLILLRRTMATQDRMTDKIKALEVQIQDFSRYNRVEGRGNV